MRVSLTKTCPSYHIFNSASESRRFIVFKVHTTADTMADTIKILIFAGSIQSARSIEVDTIYQSQISLD